MKWKKGRSAGRLFVCRNGDMPRLLMLTHQALNLLKRRAGLTNSRCVKFIESWY